MDTPILITLKNLSAELRSRGFVLTVAESCTGGGVAAALTELPGSSAWFERGFVTYSNTAKIDMLGIDPQLIEKDGAVSESVAMAMAQGALAHSRADVALSITGIAGPDGGSAQKPVGTVWFGMATREKPAEAFMRFFQGDRASIRQQAILSGLSELIYFISSCPQCVLGDEAQIKC